MPERKGLGKCVAQLFRKYNGCSHLFSAVVISSIIAKQLMQFRYKRHKNVSFDPHVYQVAIHKSLQYFDNSLGKEHKYT